MSFQAKDSQTLNQQLKVQEIVVRAEDKPLYVVSTDVIIKILEPVDSACLCLVHDNSAGTLATVAMASLVVCDSTAYTSGGDRGAVRITGLASLDANDRVVLKYITSEV